MNRKLKKGLVSVIIPVYNVSEYLSRCLDSIINQSYNNLEIIIVDDGSTDNSYKICKKYEEMDSRIRVIHKENGGAASARKVGLLSSCGEYIAMIDADDWIHPQYFSILVNIQKRSGIACYMDIVQHQHLQQEQACKPSRQLVYITHAHHSASSNVLCSSWPARATTRTCETLPKSVANLTLTRYDNPSCESVISSTTPTMTPSGNTAE